MRAKLLEKIKGDKIDKGPADTRIITSLILEHLTSQNFKFTLSVFIPECGDPDCFYSPSELSQLLKLEYPASSSILAQILSNYSYSIKKPHMKDSATQSVDASAINSLEAKLASLDMNFAQRKSVESPTLQEKILKVQRECESRMQQELYEQVKRIRESEITSMKLEEASKYQQLLQKFKNDLEKKYEKEFEVMKIREQRNLEVVKAKESEIEQKAFMQRQEILRDTEKNQEIISEYRKKIEKEAQEMENIKKVWEERLEVYTSQLKKLGAENEDLKLQRKQLENDLKQARKEIRLLADSQNRMISELSLKESEFKLLSDEHDHFQIIFTELKDRLNRAKSEHESETEKLKKALNEYTGKDVVSDYLLERKVYWNKLEREEFEIKKGLFEVLKPAPAYNSKSSSEKSHKDIEKKEEKPVVAVKTQVIKYQAEENSSEEIIF